MEMNPYESPRSESPTMALRQPKRFWSARVTSWLGAIGIVPGCWVLILHWTPDRLPLIVEVIGGLLWLVGFAVFVGGAYRMAQIRSRPDGG